MTMIRFVIARFLVVVAAITLMSCSKSVDYDFVISNETDYQINSFIIGSGDDRLELSISPHETLEMVTYEFDGTYFNFNEPLLTLAIKQYSDSIDIYDYNTGGVVSIPDLHKKATNRLSIKLAEESSKSSVIFDVETN